MLVKFQDRQEQQYEGKIVIFGDCIEISKIDDFETIAKRLTHKHKKKATDVLAESIHLYYKTEKNSNSIIISEDRLIDKARLSQTKKNSFEMVAKRVKIN